MNINDLSNTTPKIILIYSKLRRAVGRPLLIDGHLQLLVHRAMVEAVGDAHNRSRVAELQTVHNLQMRLHGRFPREFSATVVDATLERPEAQMRGLMAPGVGWIGERPLAAVPSA